MKTLSWAEVFSLWRTGEAANPHWIELYQSRGFDSWDAWRRTYSDPFKCPQRSWSLYSIKNPLETIPTFHGGPFRSWIERYYHGRTNPAFADLIALPGVVQNKRAQELAANFPAESTLTGLVQNDEVVIIEGMHRCVAVTLAAQQHKPLDATVFIALADASGEELPVVGKVTTSS